MKVGYPTHRRGEKHPEPHVGRRRLRRPTRSAIPRRFSRRAKSARRSTWTRRSRTTSWRSSSRRAFPRKLGLPELKSQIQVGASPRATLALAKASRAQRVHPSPRLRHARGREVDRLRCAPPPRPGDVRSRSRRRRQRADHQKDPRAGRSSVSDRPGDHMLPEELIHRVRHIEITTRKMVDDLMSGSVPQQFQGRRACSSPSIALYVPGDDIRHIDWKVSARSREPLIKKIRGGARAHGFSGRRRFGLGELRNLAETEIGNRGRDRAECWPTRPSMRATRSACCCSAARSRRSFRPSKGTQHILRIIRDILSFKPQHQGHGSQRRARSRWPDHEA